MIISEDVKLRSGTMLCMQNKLSGQYTFRIPVELEAELERVAQAERRKRSDIARFLIERGLAAYKRDLQLFEALPPTAANDGGKKEKPGLQKTGTR